MGNRLTLPRGHVQIKNLSIRLGQIFRLRTVGEDYGDFQIGKYPDMQGTVAFLHSLFGFEWFAYCRSINGYTKV
jgi:hypothetical protein